MIIADRSLPFIQDLVLPWSQCLLLPREEITHSKLLASGATALLIRSTLPCRAELLEDTAIRFIATATAGYDHIDTEYCQEKGIIWTNAPGCNARSVAQWEMARLSERAIREKRPLAEEVLGIVGVGHVGREVLRMADALGMKTLLCDPPRAELEGDETLVSLDEIVAQASIIVLHTPLTRGGRYPTYHMLDASLLSRLPDSTLLVNAARGAVIDNEALLHWLKGNPRREAILDVWEGEPHPLLPLLARVSAATPHIAGFSLDSKAKASRMIATSLWQYLSPHTPLPDVLREGVFLGSPSPIDASIYTDFIPERCLVATMPQLAPTETLLRQSPETFEQQRISYVKPREPEAYDLYHVPALLTSTMQRLGFHLV